MVVPIEVYSAIASVLNVDGIGALPCNTTQNIVFTFGNLDIVLKPDDYIDRTYERRGRCYFKCETTAFKNFFELPYTVLRERCFLLDYKNKQIGFADKKQ